MWGIDVSKLAKTLWRALTVAGKGVLGLLVAVVVASWVGLSLGLIDDPKLVIGLSSALLVGGVIFLGHVSRSVDRLKRRLEGFLEESSLQLYSLADCQENLKIELGKVQPGQKILLHHLGLDMDRAWLRIEEALEGLQVRRPLELQLLMITDRAELLGQHASEEIKKLCRNVPGSLEKIGKSVERIGPQLEGRGIELRVTVKLYREVPTIHGFSVEEPFRTRYFSFCRWQGREGKSFDWGDRRYRIIAGEPSDPSVADLADMFDGAFAHLWHTSPTGFQWPPAKAAGGQPG